MDTLEKLFAAVRNAPSARMKRFALTELVKRVPEFPEHALIVLRHVYSLIRSEDAADRRSACEVLRAAEFLDVRFSPDSACFSEGTPPNLDRLSRLVYLQKKDDISEVPALERNEQRRLIRKRLRLDHADDRFIEALGTEEPSPLSRFETAASVDKKEIESVEDFFSVLPDLLLSPDWHDRHGAFLAHAALLSLSVAPRVRAARICVSITPDLLQRIFEIFYNDKFNDFQEDRAGAPVREAAAELLRLVFPLVKTAKKIVVAKLVDLAGDPDWQVQFSGLLGLRALTPFLWPVLDATGVCGLVVRLSELLESTDEDVCYLAAEILGHLVRELKSIAKGDIKGIGLATSEVAAVASDEDRNRFLDSDDHSYTSCLAATREDSASCDPGGVKKGSREDGRADDVNASSECLWCSANGTNRDQKISHPEDQGEILYHRHAPSLAELATRVWARIESDCSSESYDRASFLSLLCAIYTRHSPADNKQAKRTALEEGLPLPESFSLLVPCFTSLVSSVRNAALGLATLFASEELLYLVSESILLAHSDSHVMAAQRVLLDSRSGVGSILADCSRKGTGDEDTPVAGLVAQFTKIMSGSLYRPYNTDDFACYEEAFFTRDGVQSLGPERILSNRLSLFETLQRALCEGKPPGDCTSCGISSKQIVEDNISSNRDSRKADNCGELHTVKTTNSGVTGGTHSTLTKTATVDSTQRGLSGIGELEMAGDGEGATSRRAGEVERSNTFTAMAFPEPPRTLIGRTLYALSTVFSDQSVSGFSIRRSFQQASCEENGDASEEALRPLSDVCADSFEKTAESIQALRKIPASEARRSLADFRYSSPFPKCDNTVLDFVRMVATERVSDLSDILMYAGRETCSKALRLVFLRLFQCPNFSATIYPAYSALVAERCALDKQLNVKGDDRRGDGLLLVANLLVFFEALGDRLFGCREALGRIMSDQHRLIFFREAVSLYLGNSGPRPAIATDVGERSSSHAVKGTVADSGNDVHDSGPVGGRETEWSGVGRVSKCELDANGNGGEITGVQLASNEGELQPVGNIKSDQMSKKRAGEGGKVLEGSDEAHKDVNGDIVCLNESIGYERSLKMMRKGHMVDSTTLRTKMDTLDKVFHEALSGRDAKLLGIMAGCRRYGELVARALLSRFDPELFSAVIDSMEPALHVLFVRELLRTRAYNLLSRVIPSLVIVPQSDIAPDLFEKIISERSELSMLVNPEKIPAYETTGTVKADLRDYQRAGVRWMAFLGRFYLNGILADDMGLGKTLQVLTYILSEMRRAATDKNNDKSEQGSGKVVANEKGIGKGLSKDNIPMALIVCPTALTAHWIDEVMRFFDYPVVLYTTRSAIPDSGVVVASYDCLRRDTGTLASKKWFAVVFDEGHVLRNRSTVLYQKASSISAKRMFILTGTPVHNSVSDLFSLFNLILPGYLGTESEFMSKYACRVNDQNADAMEERLSLLQKRTLPFVLRRLKADVLQDLPPKIVRDVLVDLSSQHRELYDQLSERETAMNDESKPVSYSSLSASESKRAGQGLKRTRRLLQIVAHPRYTLENISAYDAKESTSSDSHDTRSSRGRKEQALPEASKVAALRDIFTMCEGSKLLIFFQQRRTIDFVIADLGLKPSEYMRIDSTVAGAERGKVAQNFNSGPCQYLFMTTACGGLGLNLTGADTVVFYEHDWNPFNDLQAMDRAHRLGQRRVVNVFRLIARNTIEERVMSYQKFKVFVAESLVTQQNTDVERMDTKDLLERFQ